MKWKLSNQAALSGLAFFASVGMTLAAQSTFVTTDVNLRSGPGMDHSKIAVVADNSTVMLHGCLKDRSWCKVDAAGTTGWLAGEYLAYTIDGQRVALPKVTANVEIPLITTEGAETAGAATGAVVGAVVGGPVGAVVGAFIGANAVSAIDKPPVHVHTYIDGHPVESYRLEGDLEIGVGLPSPVIVHTVPDYDYRYTVVNGKTVLVDDDRRVVYIY